MTEYTREEILENRQKWIDFLKQPERKKAKGFLSRGGENRCCLGHAEQCFRGDPEKIGGHYYYMGEDADLTFETQERLGMWTRAGNSQSRFAMYRGFGNLANLNDSTNMRPQKIGAYLETVIEGGENTPFRPLTMYNSSEKE